MTFKRIIQAKPPSTQRRFATPWGELDYLCRKIRYWLYVREQKTAAERYADRLAKTLKALPANGIAIIREEALALLHQLKGRLEQAIVHRQREIQLMLKLRQEAQSPQYSIETQAYLLRERGPDELRERRAILAALEKCLASRNQPPAA